ncbi:SET domain-containing protein [Dendrothele bispora CBS 962.96]|uniref:SET domain-containing protein n=1 Tax=Dendrothele bispora (strain CBS 962.96) TaxID=1314807 RepID=A0A4S8MDR2_DENBC|nr:SET domain-containing protein [Dendrothele bispora CBS 962.96]
MSNLTSFMRTHSAVVGCHWFFLSFPFTKISLHKTRTIAEEVLEVEVVRRLVAQGFTDKMIDETKLLGNELRYSHNWGLLWEYSQRDALHWPATFSNLPHLDYFNPSAMTENEALDVGLSRFCPSLNCAHQCCGIHNNELGPPTNKAYKDSTSIWVTVGTKGPCGSDCIHYRERPDLEDITSDQLQDWDENDIEFLRYNLQMEPDASPCNLAVICEKPCWEIFVYRKELIPDEDIEDPFTIEEGPTRLPANFNDGVTNDGVFDIRVDPCSHKGPCGRDSSCPCFLEGQFCQRSCRCSDKCTLRFAGCSCSDHCARATCKCRKYSRECDPLLCRRCDAGGEREYNLRSNRTRKRSRNNGPLRFCQNTGIQRQDFPVIEIMPAKYGFGAFTTTSIPEGTCIGEYTGEIHRFSGDILSQALSTSREVLNNFRELNYMFSLEKTKHEEVLVDAAAVGNETRYLNHNDEKRSNCEARHCLVNGERRISFITTKKIAARKELFINYGELYWGMG